MKNLILFSVIYNNKLYIANGEIFSLMGHLLLLEQVLTYFDPYSSDEGFLIMMVESISMQNILKTRKKMGLSLNSKNVTSFSSGQRGARAARPCSPSGRRGSS
uniref:Uncharacterized protein n=1 Tax=Morchella importuna TaxID=1174673 RepID=A0A650AFG7_9PEZI|nr:hypothetical protein [Morchella importuna]QGN66795.1 hypothetical protein [Morchella importuna]